MRLKGFRFKLKRTRARDALDLQGEDVPQLHPAHIELLETLNIFGIRSNYMKEFEEYLEEEGVGEDERREIIFLPTIKLPAFARDEIQLSIIRPKTDMPDFKKSVRLTLHSLEGRLNNKVVADWYPRLQKRSSVGGSGTAASAGLNRENLRSEHLAFLAWDPMWFELERHKRDNAYYNVIFSAENLRRLLHESWWYELFIPPGYLDFRGLEQRPLWQEVATHLLIRISGSLLSVPQAGV